MIDKHASGDIPTLQGGKSKIVRAFPILGLGNIEIDVMVSMFGLTPIKKSIEGIALGFITIVKS